MTCPQAQPRIGSTTELLRGATWHRSSHSGTDGNCVEVARNLPGIVAVRDSKNPDGPKLRFTSRAWVLFISGVRTGELGP
jgi:hypothetical protein